MSRSFAANISLKPCLATLGLATLTAFNTAAQAVTVVGLTSSNEIARIDTANIGAATRVAISGLAPGDRFIGLDLRRRVHRR